MTLKLLMVALLAASLISVRANPLMKSKNQLKIILSKLPDGKKRPA